MTWDEFSAVAPEIAAFGLKRFGTKVAYLATLRRDGSPRLHPVSPFVAGGRLFVYMEPTSPKGHDLRRDPRYSLHCSVADIEGGEGEFLVSGRARFHDDPKMREVAFAGAREAGFAPRERYVLFELGVESCLATSYGEDGPQRLRWKQAEGL
ncbi:MAG TPA: pyridoxamine 5'-phosphate oxidase family protein [Blastocatellia bacterium]|nr:pyridoxamine 5'-phosphate oxidase family protein [Blastocatellia bacterium]